MLLSAADARRFHSKVSRGSSETCWLWTGSRLNARGGYGQVHIQHRTLYAHRIAFEIASGCPPRGYVCHTCDNAPCCNPNHLYDGTLQQNAQDAARLGRMGQWDRRGERNPAARLTEGDIRVIREALVAGTQKTVLAKHYGVTRTAIYLIGTRKNWPQVL